jgi:hypothetical protein
MMVAGQPNTISNVCFVLKYIQYVCIYYKILLSNTAIKRCCMMEEGKKLKKLNEPRAQRTLWVCKKVS